MKKIGYLLASLCALLICIKLVSSFQEAPERVCDILKHWSWTWFKGGLVATIIACIIFFINHKVEEEHKMRFIGVPLFTLLTPFLLYLFFGYNLWLTIFGLVAGLILGALTHIVDDGLLEVWEIRQVSLPIVFGLGFAGSVIVSSITETWQDEKIFVTDHATCTEVSVKRYTMHITKSGKSYTTYYSWDHHRTYYFFERGENYPDPTPDVDFTLGTGAFGEKDRYGFIYHDWAGGYKVLSSREISEQNKKYLFKWIYMFQSEKISFEKGILYDIDENFYGQAKNSKEYRKQYLTIDDIKPVTENLPTEDDVPGVFGMFWSFIKILATNPDFSLLRYIYLLLYLPFFILMIFVQELRISFLIFIVSSTIIALILIAILLARSGDGLSNIKDRFSGGFGGGSSGGGGAGNDW